MAQPSTAKELSIEKDQIKIKLELIHELLSLIENYQPQSVGYREAERLRHYVDVINEELTFVIESRIRGELSSTE